MFVYTSESWCGVFQVVKLEKRGGVQIRLKGPERKKTTF
jgi:hypothetical protein